MPLNTAEKAAGEVAQPCAGISSMQSRPGRAAVNPERRVVAGRLPALHLAITCQCFAHVQTTLLAGLAGQDPARGLYMRCLCWASSSGRGWGCAQVGDYPAAHLFNTSKWFANVPAVVVAAPADDTAAANRSAWVMRLSTPVFSASAVPTLTFLASPVTPGAADAAAAPLRRGGLAETYLNNGTAGVSAVGAWPDLATPLFLSNITIFMEVSVCEGGLCVPELKGFRI